MPDQKLFAREEKQMPEIREITASKSLLIEAQGLPSSAFTLHLHNAILCIITNGRVLLTAVPYSLPNGRPRKFGTVGFLLVINITLLTAGISWTGLPHLLRML